MKGLKELVMQDIASWGEILLIVRTSDGVFECAGPIMAGQVGRGYYNLGHGSPIRGHLLHERCRAIRCVTRKFQGKETWSVWFFNPEGDCMFKIFVGRDGTGELLSQQVERFRSMGQRVTLVKTAS